MAKSVDEAIMNICRENPRYAPQAYYFIYEALDFTLQKMGLRGHISGSQLLDGIRRCANERFGLLAETVFREWGVKSTEDFGEIVFDLVAQDALGKTDDDSKEEFRAVYDFKKVFGDLKELSKEWKIQE